jgi:hypothetical protein
LEKNPCTKNKNFIGKVLLDDFNIDSYAEMMKRQGRDPQDAVSLGAFAYIGLRNSDGTPNPALEVWDGFRISVSH